MVDASKLLEIARGLEGEGRLALRNRVLLCTLLETGCLVSEVARLQFDQFDFERGVLEVQGKAARSIPISQQLLAQVASLRESGPGRFLFLGFNRFGPLAATPVTPRGVEMLVKAHASRLGAPELTPRVIRHSVVVAWARSGVEIPVIRERLGLKTDYAFRAYAPLLRDLGP